MAFSPPAQSMGGLIPGVVRAPVNMFGVIRSASTTLHMPPTPTPERVHAAALRERGYLVMPLFDATEIDEMKELYRRTLKNLPEYTRSYDPANMQYSKTGFGALGAPSTFHNSFVRYARLRAYKLIAPILFEFDRLDLKGVSCSIKKNGDSVISK